MMKKIITLLILSLTFVYFGTSQVSGWNGTPGMDASWNCVQGKPQVTLEWNGDYEGFTILQYFIRRDGKIIATLPADQHIYTDSGVSYNDYYHYVLDAETTPSYFAPVDGGDQETGSCMYVSVSGPSSVNVGDYISISGSYVWGSGSATYSLGLYDNSLKLIHGWGGSGLTGSPKTVTTPPTQIVADVAPGTYKICAEGSVAGASDSDCASITVVAPPTPPASMTHTANTSSVDVGGSVTTSGSGTNVTSCSKTATIPPGKPSVSYFENYPAIGGNVTVPQTTVTGFSQPTADIPYYLNLTCNGNFASLDKTSNLAGVLSPFLGFIKVAYAAPSSNTIPLPVYVNALPNAVLNVNSVGASGVSVIGVSGAPSGTTDPTSYSYSSTSQISGTLAVGQTAPNGTTFTGWSGCDGVTLYSCHVVVNPGETQTVTVYFSQPVPTSPNLKISGGIGVTPSSPTVGQNVSFSATVLNNGNASAGGNSTTQLKIDTGDNGGGSLWDITSNKTTGNLVSGGTENESWNNAWTAVEGFHRIRVCADNGGVISESNESDNCTDAYVTVGEEEPPLPPPPPPPSSWDYTLSDTSPLSINKADGVGQKVITRTLTSGTAEGSTISLSGVPAGVGYTISTNPCTPTCNSTINFTVDASAPNGTSPITVTGQPGNKTMNFNLIITGNAMNVTCVPDPAVAMIGQPVTWDAKALNGNPPYTSYVWSGTGVPTDPAPTANPYSLTYSTIGQKTISVEVTDSLGEKASCPSNSSVQINFNPSFEEF